MNSLILYTNPMSRGRIVRWMLEEIGAPYDVRVLEFGAAMKTPEYLALNPMGKVPTLVHDGIVVTEVAAICAYLAESFPERALAPALRTPARAAYHRWLAFITGPLEMAITVKQNGWAINDDNSRAIGCGRLEDVLQTLGQQLATGGWLCGEDFTVVDLLLASYLGWYIQFQQIEPKPAYTAYVARAHERAAAQRAVQLDDALIKG